MHASSPPPNFAILCMPPPPPPPPRPPPPPSQLWKRAGGGGGVTSYIIFRGGGTPPKNVSYIFPGGSHFSRVKGVGILRQILGMECSNMVCKFGFDESDPAFRGTTATRPPTFLLHFVVETLQGTDWLSAWE